MRLLHTVGSACALLLALLVGTPALGAESASKVLVVLPLDTSNAKGKLDSAAQASIEEMLRDVAATALGSGGWTILTGENTLQVLQDNGVDANKCGDQSCHLSMAREIKASKFISGTIQHVEGVFLASIRLIDTATGRIVASERVEAPTVTVLRKEFEKKSDAFFTRGGLVEAAPAPAPAPVAAPTPAAAPVAPAPVPAVVVPPLAQGAAGSWQRLGKPGEWKGTIAAAGLNGQLYTIESSGVLYVTDATTGRWASVGKPEFKDTVHLFAANGQLYTIERDGSLYRVNPANGAWAQVGPAKGWKDTLAGTELDGRLYTAEVSGALYVTDLGAGTWQQLGKPDFAGTAYLMGLGGWLYSIERDGSLYRISPRDGSWVRIGKQGEWANTIAAAAIGGKLITVEKSGALYSTDPQSGRWVQLGKPDFAGTRRAVSTGQALLTLESDGSLYRVQVQ